MPAKKKIVTRNAGPKEKIEGNSVIAILHGYLLEGFASLTSDGRMRLSSI